MQSSSVTCRRRAPVAVYVCLVGIACIATAATADDPCTKVFVSGGSDADMSWHLDANWNPFGVPGPTDVACILDPGNYMVLVDEPVTVAGLRIDTDAGNVKVKILATDFTLNGFAFLAGATKLKVNDGAVLRSDAGGLIEVHSKLVIEGGTVEVGVELYGHLNWWGTGSVTGTLVTHPGSVIEVEDPEAEAHLTVDQGFDLHGDLVFNNTVEQSFTVTAGSLVVTATGTISTRATAGAAQIVPELRAELVNHGLILVDGLDLRLSRGGSQHQNGADGVIQVSDAELEIDLGSLVEVPSNFTNYGTITVADGGRIRVVGSSGEHEVPSNFTNYGTTTVAGGGSIRILGSSGEKAAMAAVNHGFIDIETDGVFGVTNAIFDNPPSGWVRGMGTLDLSQSSGVIFDGTLSPGLSPGILTIDGSMNVGTNTMIPIEIGGETPGSNLDRLDLTGTLGAAGSLAVLLDPPYQPSGGERYQILTFDQLNGWFEKVDLPQLMHLLVWDVDIDEHEVGLEVLCQGTQLGIELAVDRDPVSVGYEVIVQARVSNHSQVSATSVVVSNALPADLAFRPDLSSPECLLIGSTVECSILSLAPAASSDLQIAVEPVVAGPVDSIGLVSAWECDTDASDDQAMATIIAVAAVPCDANDDLSIDADDVVAAVGHIFGERADGNPDCRLADGITADDLAAIIEASQ